MRVNTRKIHWFPSVNSLPCFAYCQEFYLSITSAFPADSTTFFLVLFKYQVICVLISQRAVFLLLLLLPTLKLSREWSETLQVKTVVDGSSCSAARARTSVSRVFGCGTRSSSLWVHRNLFLQLLRDGNLHGSGMSHHDSLSKTILQGTLEGGRRRGRQRKCWVDNMKEWTSLTMPKLFTNASCGKGWKRVSAESSLMSPRTTKSVKGLNWRQEYL